MEITLWLLPFLHNIRLLVSSNFILNKGTFYLSLKWPLKGKFAALYKWKAGFMLQNENLEIKVYTDYKEVNVIVSTKDTRMTLVQANKAFFSAFKENSILWKHLAVI